MTSTGARSSASVRLDRWFEITARGSNYRAEILGGATTFLTLVYIVFVNPSILSSVPDLHGTMMGIFVIDGLVIVALVVVGLRERIIDAIPYDLKLAIGIGIGAFITIVGLKNAGFILAGGQLGTLGHLGTWRMLVFVVGLFVTWTLYDRGVRGALLIGIVGATVLATVINALDHYEIWTDGSARLPRGAWLTARSR